MIKSLRWRLQIWYACLLLFVVGGFGSILYYETRAAKLQEIDGQLEAAALYLDAALRSFPDFELDGREPPMFDPRDKKGPRGGPFGQPPFEMKDKKGFKPGPPLPPLEFKDKKGPRPPWPKERERLLAELKFPRELQGPADAPAYFGVWRSNGTQLKATALPEGAVPTNGGSGPARPRAEQRGDYREVSMRGPRETRIIVGRTVAREQDALYAFAWQIAGIGAAVLVVGLAGGFWLASRIFRPIAAMSAAASAINATNLSTRIETRDVDVELAGLAKVLNAMFDRLEGAFERQQQFTADASHELRTPLAILRANAELALSQSRSVEEYRHTIEMCLSAAERMSNLVQGLLTLARADAGNPGLHLKPVRLDELVIDSITQVKPLADEKKITLTADILPATIKGDADSLTQLVSNLLSNAIHHNNVGGKVHVRVSTPPDAVVLAIADTGPGIPEKDRPQIFKRFFRVDKARARASGGAGLGLAICKAIADAHHAVIDFDSVGSDGTTFRVVFPQRAAVESGIRKP